MNGAAQTLDPTPLPSSQDYGVLLGEGIERLKHRVGHKWSDFNESDPGVTILQQLVYALTELGYCTDFPMADILTQSNGNIPYERQFFTPDEILTCSPITTADYQRLIFDEFAEINRVDVIPINVSPQTSTGCLQAVVSTSQPDSIPVLSARIDRLLSRHRNVGEFFAPTLIRSSVSIQIDVQLTLDSTTMRAEIKRAINSVLLLAEKRSVEANGFSELSAQGYTTNEIFNGPNLKNGWFPSSEFNVDRKPSIDSESDATTVHGNEDGVTQRFDATSISLAIAQIPGVQSVDALDFSSDHENVRIVSQASGAEVVVTGQSRVNFEVRRLSVSQADMGFGANHQTRSFSQLKLKHRSAHSAVNARVDRVPPLPKGTYRDIASYYSVQHTFPSQYQLSTQVTEGHDEYRNAQTQQLRGYLMVFDQLLANQFSQLANIDNLFELGLPSRVAENHRKTDSKTLPLFFDSLLRPEIASTYFHQPLYQVPGASDLLKGTEQFNYRLRDVDAQSDAYETWRRYQQDPFNLYIRGLDECMESESDTLRRRGRFLDHLLARHGENPALIDQVVDWPRWRGSVAFTRLIVKSCLLRHYAQISYRRVKGYNEHECRPIGSPGRFRLTVDDVQMIQRSVKQLGIADNISESLRALANLGFGSRKKLFSAVLTQIGDTLTLAQRDWLLNHLPSSDNRQCNRVMDKDPGCAGSEPVITAEDFADFSTFELKTDLMLGLGAHYADLITVLSDLLNDKGFAVWINQTKSRQEFHLPDTDISVARKADCDQICVDDNPVMQVSTVQGKRTHAVYQAHIDQLAWLKNQRRGFLFVEGGLLEKRELMHLVAQTSRSTTAGSEASSSQERTNGEGKSDVAHSSTQSIPHGRHPWLTVVSAVPGYVLKTHTPGFCDAFVAVARDSVPAHINHGPPVKLSFSNMYRCIQAYINVHGAVRTNSVPKPQAIELLTRLLNASSKVPV